MNELAKDMKRIWASLITVNNTEAADVLDRAIDEIERLRASVVGVNVGVEWQPIETAPKDGTVVDLWVRPHDAFENGNADRVEAFWMERVGWRRTGWGYVKDCGVPTHWMRKPQPPSDVGVNVGVNGSTQNQTSDTSAA